jgi:RND family efflux transporter MFP subunit
MSATLRCLVAGNIGTIDVREGQTVRAGDRLVTLDDRLVRSQLHIAELEAAKTGDLNRAKSQLALAERQLSRLERAFEHNGVADFELEEQRARVEQARAIHLGQLESKELAEGHLRLAREQLRRLSVFAPFNGIVTQIHANLGESVDATAPVVSVANLDALEVELHAPVQLFGSIQPGSSLNLLAGAPVNTAVDAKVIFASPIVNSASGTFRCVLRIDNAGRTLPAGFSVNLTSPP